MSNEINLASESNAKKINIRFKELENEILELREIISMQQNAIQTLDGKLNSQMEMYTQFFVAQYGTGSTVPEES